MNSTRTIRIARFLREAVHYDPATRQKYRYIDRNKALEKYRGQSAVFVSFTELKSPVDPQKNPYQSRKDYTTQPKLGINPKTPHSTPLGVYGYPIDYTLDNYDERSGRFTVPYGSGASLIHIFRVLDMDRVLILEPGSRNSDEGGTLSSGGEQIYDQVEELVDRVVRYVDRTRSEIPDKPAMDLTLAEYDQFRDWCDSWIKGLYEETGLGKISDGHISYLIRDSGHLYPRSVYMLSRDDFPRDRVLTGVRDYLVLNYSEVTYPYEKELKKLPEVSRFSDREYKRIKEDVAHDRYGLQPFIYKMAEKISRGDPVKWTSLMRKVGLVGVIDYGNGIIFSGEPTQAVFFNPGSLQVLETLDNRVPQPVNQRDPTRKNLSEWAQGGVHYFTHAVSEISKSLKLLRNYGDPISTQNLQNGDYYPVYAALWDIQRYISWLKQHRDDDPDWGQWSPLVKKKIQRVIPIFLDPVWGQNPETPIIRRAQIISRLLDSF